MLEINEEEKTISPIITQNINSKYFGEGITVLNDTHYLALTWTDKVMLIVDRQTLEVTNEIPVPKGFTEGWGLTHDSKWLYYSDGTNLIYGMSPNKLDKIDRLISVKRRDHTPMRKLNEMELIKDKSNGKDYLWVN
jgi:glutamine cyclotransferase